MCHSDREALLRLVERRPNIDDRFTDMTRVGNSGGHGHFSLLFRARDLTTGRLIALKFYNPIRRFDPDSTYRLGCFQREARILQDLGGERDIIGWVSPVSEFVETFQAHGIPLNVPFAFFGLELAETDLASVINSASIAPEDLIRTFHVMCRSVKRLHQLGYTHRDLKPSNFLFLADGSVKLSDFGTARRMDNTSPQLASNYIFPPGDLAYASPEALACLLDDDAQLAFKADVFALAAILFEMVTGTVLGMHLFDQSFRSDLTSMMAVINRGQRKTTFDKLIGAIADGHPLPNLYAFAPAVPKSILPLLDDLVRSMAHLDHRKRLCDFDRIFLRLRSCLLVLQNEVKYRRWREKRETYKLARQKKLLKRSTVASASKDKGQP